jgi:hypothetical protein
MERPFPAYQGSEPYIFVCYAHDDMDVVYAELEWLRADGVNVWYDEGISPGASVRGRYLRGTVATKCISRSTGTSRCWPFIWNR